jgi:hypothetical protein
VPQARPRGLSLGVGVSNTPALIQVLQSRYRPKISKCASVGTQAVPLIGNMSCGQADMATTQSMAARKIT